MSYSAIGNGLFASTRRKVRKREPDGFRRFPEADLELQLRESIRQVEERKGEAMQHTNGSLHAGEAGLNGPPAAPYTPTTNDGHDIRPIPQVYAAICQVAKALSHDGVAKDRKNQQQGYSFRGIDEIMNALSAPLAEADLCILPRMFSRTQEERQSKEGKPLWYVTVHAHFAFVCARDGSRHTVATYGEAMDSADKATNKAMSAAYKYACMQAFCIPTEAMPDADQTTHDPTPKQPAAAQSSTPKPNTQAAASAVAAEKIAAGRAATSKPWENRGQMKRAFGILREQVGEVAYLTELARYGVTPELQWKSADAAVECWHHLDHIAKKEVA